MKTNGNTPPASEVVQVLGFEVPLALRFGAAKAAIWNEWENTRVVVPFERVTYDWAFIPVH